MTETVELVKVTVTLELTKPQYDWLLNYHKEHKALYWSFEDFLASLLRRGQETLPNAIS